MSMDCFVVPPYSPISSLAAAGIGFDGSPLSVELEDKCPWPHAGQQFDVVIIVTGGGKWELERELCEDTIPPEVSNAMSEVGMGLDEPLFVQDELPKKAGRYNATLEYWHQDSIDWETGHNDPDFGFNIIKLEKQGVLPAIGRALARLVAYFR